MNIRKILEEKLPYVQQYAEGTDVYFAPNIPEKKLRNMASTVANGINPAEILAIYDITFFGSATDGIAFTEIRFYAHYEYNSLGNSRANFAYKDIDRIDVKTVEGKETIFIYDKTKLLWRENTKSYNYIALKDLLLSLIPNETSVESEPQSEISTSAEQQEEASTESPAQVLNQLIQSRYPNPTVPTVYWSIFTSESNELSVAESLTTKEEEIKNLPSGDYTIYLAPNIDNTILKNALQFVMPLAVPPNPLSKDDVLAICVVNPELKGFHSLLFTKAALYIKLDGYYKRIAWASITEISLLENILIVKSNETINLNAPFNTSEFAKFLIQFVKTARMQDKNFALSVFKSKNFPQNVEWDNYLPYLADYTDENGDDILMIAYACEQKNLVRLLLKNLPSNYSHRNRFGETFLTLSVVAGDDKLTKEYFSFNSHSLLPLDLYSAMQSANKDYKFSKNVDVALDVAGGIGRGLLGFMNLMVSANSGVDSYFDTDTLREQHNENKQNREAERNSQLASKTTAIINRLNEAHGKNGIQSLIEKLKSKIVIDEKSLQEEKTKIEKEINNLKAAKVSALSEPKGEFETTSDYNIRLQKAQNIDSIFETEFADEIQNIKDGLTPIVEENSRKIESDIDESNKRIEYYNDILTLKKLDDMAEVKASKKNDAVYYLPRKTYATQITLGSFNADESFFPVVFEMQNKETYTYKVFIPISVAPEFKKDFSADLIESNISLTNSEIVEMFTVSYKDKNYTLEFVQ